MQRRRNETKRCFPTKCRDCGEKVLYWESVAGAKVFLQLPIYGKPHRHICNNLKKAKKSFVVETHIDHLKKLQKKQITYQCPVCAKIFAKEPALNKHMKDLKDFDEAHAQFYFEILDFLQWEPNSSQKSKKVVNETFQTKHELNSMNDRFILKSKDPKNIKKFEKLIRRKRNN